MTPLGLAQLRTDEGLRLHAYPDPRSGAEPWTCGYGCTGPGIGPHTVWSLATASFELSKRVAETEAALRHALPWFSALEREQPARSDVLVNMGYNMGVDGLLEFHSMLAAVEGGRYATAALDMLGSEWARQVNARAERLASIMRGKSEPITHVPQRAATQVG